jgi:uncharacterized membrane protein YphA (DoxX/SURF4 family)
MFSYWLWYVGVLLLLLLLLLLPGLTFHFVKCSHSFVMTSFTAALHNTISHIKREAAPAEGKQQTAARVQVI